MSEHRTVFFLLLLFLPAPAESLTNPSLYFLNVLSLLHFPKYTQLESLYSAKHICMHYEFLLEQGADI